MNSFSNRRPNMQSSSFTTSNIPNTQNKPKPKRRANQQAMAGRPQNKPKPNADPYGRNMQRGLGNQGQNQQVDYSDGMARVAVMPHTWEGYGGLSIADPFKRNMETISPQEQAALRAGLQGSADPMARPVGTGRLGGSGPPIGVGMGGGPPGGASSFTTSNIPNTQRHVNVPDEPINRSAMSGRPEFVQPGTNAAAMSGRPEFTYNQPNPLAMAGRPDMPGAAEPVITSKPVPTDPFGRNIQAIDPEPEAPYVNPQAARGGADPASAMDSPLQMQAEANQKALNAGLGDPFGRNIQALEPQEGGFGGSPLQRAELQRAAGARDAQDENARIEAQQTQMTQEVRPMEPPPTALGQYTQGDRAESAPLPDVNTYGATAEPPAVDPFRAQLQQAIQGRLGADSYTARQTAAEADYQVQADKAREALSERLNRLGVLRGGGATASQFGEFESGVLRGQQALGAQYEGQRQAGIEKAIEQGVGMYEAGGRQDISREQQRMQEIEMFGGEAGPEGRGTLARRLGVGGMDLQGAQLEEQRQARLQRGTEGELQRDLSREELYGGVTRPVDRASTLAAKESAAQRGLQSREIEQRGTLAEADIASREGLAREDRLLGREELYGSGDTLAQQGSTLASQELAQRGSQFDKEISSRERMAQEQRLLGREELYGTGDVSAQRGSTLAAKQSRQDLALRSELGRGQLGLAQTELYGQDVSDMSPMQIQALGGTLAAREATAGREFESGERALDRGVTTQEGQRNRTLAREELYGSATRTQGETSLASRDLGLRQEVADDRSTLARSELYGQSLGGTKTLQGRLADEEQERFGAATTLEAERYKTERGDYTSEISRRNEQDRLQKQYEGLGAQRAIDALKQGDSTYAASEEEQALVSYLLRGGQGQIGDYLVDPVDTVPDPDAFPQPVYTGTQGEERAAYRRPQYPRSQRTKTGNI